MTSVAELQTQISNHRNTLDQYAQRSKPLLRLVEKEQTHVARLTARVEDVGRGGLLGGRKIVHDLTHSLRYKERRLKRFSDELILINKQEQPVTEKLIELESIMLEVQSQIASADAAEKITERKAEIAASLGVEPSAIADDELLPRE
jgi:chromosome segregation ATPase